MTTPSTIIQYCSVLPNAGGVVNVLTSIVSSCVSKNIHTRVVIGNPVDSRYQYARQLNKIGITPLALDDHRLKFVGSIIRVPLALLSSILVLPYCLLKRLKIGYSWKRIFNDLYYTFYGKHTIKKTEKYLEESLLSCFRQGPCILHLHYLGWERCRMVMGIAKKNKIPMVLHYHNDVSFSQDKIHEPLLNNIEKLFPERAVLAVLSERLKVAMEKRVKTKVPVVVIPNWIEDIAKPHSVSKNISVGGPLRATIVSRLIGGKGIEDCIRALVLLGASDVDVVLTIVGEGLGRRFFEDIAERIGVLNRVTFAGQLKEKEVDEIVANTDVFLLPSSTEGLPIVLLKAMMYGVPVVVTPVGAMPEIIEKADNGLIVEVGNVPQLAEALKKLSNDLELRKKMGKNGRRYFEENHTAERVWPGLEKIYRELLQVEL